MSGLLPREDVAPVSMLSSLFFFSFFLFCIPAYAHIWYKSHSLAHFMSKKQVRVPLTEGEADDFWAKKEKKEKVGKKNTVH